MNARKDRYAVRISESDCRKSQSRRNNMDKFFAALALLYYSNRRNDPQGREMTKYCPNCGKEQ